ncbi:MAG: Hdr-like menaquinol oxidoreductase cytochrome c subunit [Betaproteobacteria bacterium]|nr:Hdr-like menaquinol oxidoreductase cytochrome c subunit [Betaproteobacteria bacterium]
MLRGALLVLATIVAVPAFAAERTPKPAIERARGGECVAPPAEMRRNHMELLKHARDETVHVGVRTAKASLNGCIECHASRATGSVAAGPRDFCVSCHSYAAVKIDCFECHASRPKPGAARAAR